MASTGEVWKLGHRPALDGVHQLRAACILLPIAVAAAFTIALRDWMPADWEIAMSAGNRLVAGDLRVYAEMPEAQMGPLALLLSGILPRWAYVSALLPLLGLLLLQAPTRTIRGSMMTGAAGLVLAIPWAYTLLSGHADEVIVLCALALLPGPIRRHSEMQVAMLLVLAVAAKPTALLLLPLALMVSRRTVAATLVGVGVIYMPFLLADPVGFIGAGGGFNAVANGSVLDFVGYESGAEFPAWVRPAQLLGGWLVLWLGVARWGLPTSFMAALFWRALLEPGPWGSYSLPIMVAALLLVDSRRTFAVVVLGFLSWVAVIGYPQSDLDGALRVLLLSAAVGVGAIRSPRTTPRTAPPTFPPRP